MLLHPSSEQMGERQEAARRLNAVVEIKKWVIEQAKKTGLQENVPDEANRVKRPGESLEIQFQ